MVDPDMGCLLVPNEYPMRGDSGPIIGDLSKLQKKRAVLSFFDATGRESACKDLFSPQFNDEVTAGRQRTMHLLQNRKVFVSLFKITERCTQVDYQVERLRTHKRAHVLLYPFNLHSFRLRQCPCFPQQKRATVDPSDLRPLPGQIDRVPPRTATQVQNSVKRCSDQFLKPTSLRFRRCQRDLRKKEGVG